MVEPIYTLKGTGGVKLTLTPLDEEAGADYRLRLDRPGLAAMSLALSNTEFDELAAARDKHRDDA